MTALVFAPAVSAVGLIEDVEVKENGRIVWKDYPGAVDYWIGVDGGSTPIENGGKISDRITEPGTYSLELDAYTANGEKLLATWEGKVEFDGSVFKLVWSEGRPAETPEPQKQNEPNGPASPAPAPGPAQEGASFAAGPLLIVIIIAFAAIVMSVAAVIIVIVIVRNRKK